MRTELSPESRPSRPQTFSRLPLRRLLSGVVAVAATGALLLPTAASAATGPADGPADGPAIGQSCTTSSGLLKLGAWQPDGTEDAVAYPVSLPGGENSALGAPPGPVAPGEFGFSADGQLATFAALLAHTGQPRLASADAAGTAVAVLAQTNPGADASCPRATPPDLLLTRAAQLAGPYTVHLSVDPTPAILGRTGTMTATVQAASGAPVPNADVTFAGGPAQLTSTQVQTGTDGTASTTFQVPSGTPAATVPMSASVTLPTGLVAVPGDPTLLAPGPGGLVSEKVQLPIDQSSHPQVSIAAPSVARTGATLPLTLQVAGMNGHHGTATVTVTGPSAFTPGGDCPDSTGSSTSPTSPTGTPAPAPSATTASGTVASGTGAGATQTVTVTGDGQIPVDAAAVTDPGCYLVAAQVATTDATPPAHAAAAPVAVLMLNPVVRLALPHALQQVGTVDASVTVSGTGGFDAVVDAALRGPVRPDAKGACPKQIADAPVADRASVTVPAGTAGDNPVTFTQVTAAGCYGLSASVHVDAGADLVVPAAGGTVLVLDPSITVEPTTTSTISPGPVPVRVSVGGLMGRAAHVQVTARFAPTTDFGCRGVNWSAADRVAAGPATAVRGEWVPVTVRTAATGRVGCYLPVPVVTLDDNPAVTVTATLDPDLAALSAAGPALASSLAGPAHPTSDSLTRVWWTLAGFGALLAAAVAFAGAAAWRSRRDDLDDAR